MLLLPVGAVEPHGPHAPSRTDSIISRAVCDRAATLLAGDEAVRALVLPEIAFGVTRYAAAFAGAVSISEDTLRALMVEICASLRAQGFHHKVVVNSHFEPGTSPRCEAPQPTPRGTPRPHPPGVGRAAHR